MEVEPGVAGTELAPALASEELMPEAACEEVEPAGGELVPESDRKSSWQRSILQAGGSAQSSPQTGGPAKSSWRH